MDFSVDGAAGFSSKLIDASSSSDAK